MNKDIKRIVENILNKKTKTKQVLNENYVGHDALLETVKAKVKSKYGIKSKIAENEGFESDAPVGPDADPVDTVTMDVTLLTSLLDFAKNAKKDENLGEIADNANKLSKEKGMLSSDDYSDIVGETLESEEDIDLNEIVITEKKKKKEKEDEDDYEPSELDSEEDYSDIPEEEINLNDPSADNSMQTGAPQDGKVDPNIKKTMDALTQAQASAKQLGDQKLLNQLGNTITFFTKTHIVGVNQQ